MRALPALESAVLMSDYREQAENIRAGRHSTKFAYEHGRTVGKMLGSVTPTLMQVPGILLNDSDTYIRKYATNGIFIEEWGRLDIALKDLRRKWPMNEKTAMFLGVLFHGGAIAAAAQTMHIENMFAFNSGMDAVDRGLGNAARAASRVVSKKKK